MKILFIIILLLTPIESYTAEKPIWIDATGETYMSENDTLKEVKERAKRDAQNKAVEEGVGVFIKSHTLVSNSQLEPTDWTEATTVYVLRR